MQQHMKKILYSRIDKGKEDLGIHNTVQGTPLTILRRKETSMRKLICSLLALALTCTVFWVSAEENPVQTILSIGTTQAFTEDAVTKNDLNLIVQAGLSTASAINQQPWYFVVITNPDVMSEIAQAAKPSGAGSPSVDVQGSAMPTPASTGAAKAGLGDSPAAIVVYMNEGTASPNASFDCGLACQNMVLAAASLGYGTKIVSSPTTALNGDDHDALCEKFGVDTAYQAVAVLLIGQADQQADAQSSASTRNTIEEKVSFVN